MAFGQQLKLLLWKNFTLRRRQKIRAVLETVVPLILFVILVLVRTRDLTEDTPTCYYPPKAFTSTGFLPFMQSYICSISNNCSQQPYSDSSGGVVTDYDQSMLTRLVSSLNELWLSDEYPDAFKIMLDSIAELLKQLDAILEPLTSSLPLVNSDGLLPLTNMTTSTRRTRKQLLENGMTVDAVDVLMNSSVTYKFLVQLVEAASPDGGGMATFFCDNVTLSRLIIVKKNDSFDVLSKELCRLKGSFIRNVFVLGPSYNFNLKLLSNFTGFNFVDISLISMRVYAFNEVFSSLQKSFQILAPVIPTNQSMFDYFTCGVLSGGGTVFTASESKIEKMRRRASGGKDTSKQKVTSSEDKPTHHAKIVINESTVATSSDPDHRPRPRIRKILFCGDVGTVINDENECQEKIHAIKNLPLMMKNSFIILFRGYLLLTPDYPAVRKLGSLINQWLEQVDVIRTTLLFGFDHSEDFIAALNGSKIGRAIRDADFVLDNLPLQTETIAWLRGLFNNLTSSMDDPSKMEPMMEQYESMIDLMRCFRTTDRVQIVNTTANYTLENYGVCLQDWGLYYGALEFDDLEKDATDLPKSTVYKIRMDPMLTDGTRALHNRRWGHFDRSRGFIDLKYSYFGFSFLQESVDHAIIQLQTNRSVNTGLFMQQVPNSCYTVDRFVRAIERTFPLFMTLSWICAAAMIIRGIVYEKESRLKEVMRIMGLNNFVHWTAWFIQSFVFMAISVAMFVLIIKFGRVITYSNPLVMLVYMLAFAASTIAQCFLFSTIFNKANLAAACGGLMYFLCFLPYPILVNRQFSLSVIQKTLSCLSSNVAFGFCCSYVAMWEEQGVGLHWDNWGTSPQRDDNFSFKYPFVMLLVDTVIYLLLTGYIETVFPGEFGIPQPWYFPVLPSFWCGKPSKLTIEEDAFASNYMVDPVNLESEPTDYSTGVTIKNLRKVYGNGKVAVDGLSLNFFENQITAFLGHNGAGKTTTLSILTGLFPPTEGIVKIRGKNIMLETDEIRRSLGMCPQHNVLFDILTVEEQLWFYAALKGVPEDEIGKDIERMLSDVGLEDKRDELAKNLSGGMQRKLSVAVAFVGGSKTVILDEPTAGVDPYARRGIWDLLLKQKEGRTIILSTHHMDEADLLGDRIAIISAGQLKCCGSSLFLKKRFGSGFYLTCVRAGHSPHHSNMQLNQVNVAKLPDVPRRASSADGDLKMIQKSNRLPPIKSNGNLSNNKLNIETPQSKEFVQFVLNEVRGARLVGDSDTEISFTLPSSDLRALQSFFKQLDMRISEFGISTYGVSDTSLEEIFLKVVGPETEEGKMAAQKCCGCLPMPRNPFRRRSGGAQETVRQNGDSTDEEGEDDMEEPDDNNHDVDDNNHAVTETTTPKITLETVSSSGLLRRQFGALFIKRFHSTRRSLKSLFCQIILPAVFVLLAMILSEIDNAEVDDHEPPMMLVPWLYAPPLYIFTSLDKPNKTDVRRQGEQVLHSLINPPGVGQRCMNDPPSDIETYFPCLPFSTKIPNGVGNATKAKSHPCACDSDSRFQCSKNQYGPTPLHWATNTTDVIVDLSGRDISRWWLETELKYREHRYGGFSLGELNPGSNGWNRDNITDKLRGMGNDLYDFFSDTAPHVNNIYANKSFADREHFDRMLAALISGSEVESNLKVWFNNKGWPSLPIYTNVLNNALLRSRLSNDQDPSDYAITTYNYPMNYSAVRLANMQGAPWVKELLRAIVMILAFSFVPASFVVFVIDERVCNSQHLQFVSGLKPWLYWCTNFAWDMLNFTVPVIICFIIFVVFQELAYLENANYVMGVILLFFFYGYSVTALMYLISFTSTDANIAFVWLGCLNVFLGVISTITTVTLEQLGADDEELKNVNDICMKAFLILPQYCLGRGLIDIKVKYYMYTLAAKMLGEGYVDLADPFEWSFLGQKLMAMFIVGTVAFVAVQVKENRIIQKLRKSNYVAQEHHLEGEDEDVAAERSRVMSGETKDNALNIMNLTKLFGSRGCLRGQKRLKAVDNLCLSVPQGQCFGLLGVNGAGKTTTFSMLTGSVKPSAGDASIAGHSVIKDLTNACRSIGFCPQFDALHGLLTGREELMFYARLRGIPEKDVSGCAEWALKHMHLLPHADRMCGTYSGGNKRKLSTAIALIGSPKVVLLDEPTTGMDPKARRFLWNRIKEIVNDGRSVIITSHSMEECEALCNRIAIMVNGKFQCLGSVQHLKNKFGGGYTLTVKLGGVHPKIDEAVIFLEDAFPGAELKEKHLNMLQYQLPVGMRGVGVGSIFEKLESGRDLVEIEDYSVTQTTLDQVFVNFAKLQKDSAEARLELGTSMCDRIMCCSKNRMKNKSNAEVEFPLDDRTPVPMSSHLETNGVVMSRLDPVVDGSRPGTGSTNSSLAKSGFLEDDLEAPIMIPVNQFASQNSTAKGSTPLADDENCLITADA